MFRFKDFTAENKIQQKELMALFNVGQSTVSHLVVVRFQLLKTGLIYCVNGMGL